MLANMVSWGLNLRPCWLWLIWKSDWARRLSRGRNWLRWSGRLGIRGLCWLPARRRPGIDREQLGQICKRRSGRRESVLTRQEFYFLTEMTILREGESLRFHEGFAEGQIP